MLTSNTERAHKSKYVRGIWCVCVCVEIQQRTIYQFSLKRQMEAVKRRLLLFILCGMRFFLLSCFVLWLMVSG